MSLGTQDTPGILQRALDFATQNLTVERILIRIGLDPNNITYDAIIDRVMDILLANITLANMLALIGGIFLISTFVVRTMVPLRVLAIFSSVFFVGAALLSGSVAQFLMHLLALPISVLRLIQIQNLVKKARSAAQGDLTLDWLRPFMTTRTYRKGDVLFHKGDAAAEMFLTISGEFLVTEIGVKIPPGRVMGELGFLSSDNHRTQSVECVEDGEVLTISYEKLLEIYFQKPEFGYYFLRLTSDRLMQNAARLEGVVAKNNAEQEAAEHATNPGTAAPARQVAAPAVVVRRRSVAEQQAARAAEWRRAHARAIVERHANYSALGGFIPVPVANVAVVGAINVRMVRALGRFYGIPIESNNPNMIAVGVMGGAMPSGLATAAASALFFVPGYNFIGLAVSSVTASVYARSIGGMLIEHFEKQFIELEREYALQRSRRWRWLRPRETRLSLVFSSVGRMVRLPERFRRSAS